MSTYAWQNDTFTEVSGAPTDALCIQVQAPDGEAPPQVRVLAGGAEVLLLAGASPRPDTDTTHTVAHVDPADRRGTPLFAVHAADTDLLFEAQTEEWPGGIDPSDIDHVQSALNEILIPVYIDDVVSDLSDRAPGLFLLHTVQVEDDQPPPWTYFRTSVFADGDLALEQEWGSL
ncbi:MAG: hypothetical protein ABEL97_16015 [Salinibacter sp.]